MWFTRWLHRVRTIAFGLGCALACVYCVLSVAAVPIAVWMDYLVYAFPRQSPSMAALIIVNGVVIVDVLFLLVATCVWCCQGTCDSPIDVA